MCQVYRIAASLGVGSSYKVREAFTGCFCPKGVGALLAGDGLRSSAEPATSVATDTPHAQVYCRSPADRRQAGLLRLRQKRGSSFPTAVTGGCFVAVSVARLTPGPVGAADPAGGCDCGESGVPHRSLPRGRQLLQGS